MVVYSIICFLRVLVLSPEGTSEIVGRPLPCGRRSPACFAFALLCGMVGLVLLCVLCLLRAFLPLVQFLGHCQIFVVLAISASSSGSNRIVSSFFEIAFSSLACFVVVVFLPVSSVRSWFAVLCSRSFQFQLCNWFLSVDWLIALCQLLSSVWRTALICQFDCGGQVALIFHFAL